VIWFRDSLANALALRELRTAAGTVQTWLFALFHTSVASQEALLTQLRIQVAVVLHECPGDALKAGPGLACAAATVNQNPHVDGSTHAGVLERRDNRVAILLDLEEVFELAVVDRELAATGANPHTGDGGLAAASSQGVDDFFCSWHGEGFGFECCVGQAVPDKCILKSSSQAKSLTYLLLSSCGQFFALLLRDRKLELGRLLGLVRMLGASVDLELGDHLESELVLRQHTANGLVQNHLWLALQPRFGGDGALARVACVPGVLFLIPLITGELHLLGVDHDDKVARINVRRVLRAVLAHEDHGNPTRQAAHYLIGGIDNVPLFLDFAGLGHVSFHDSSSADSFGSVQFAAPDAGPPK
jgi:hypothetical protein